MIDRLQEASNLPASCSLAVDNSTVFLQNIHKPTAQHHFFLITKGYSKYFL